MNSAQASMYDDMIHRIEHLKTIRKWSKRGAELRDWATSPTDPAPGSSLQLDDAGFLPELELENPVTWHARFPASVAAEHLAAVEVLASNWLEGTGSKPGGSPAWPSSILVLCRTAVETSARTIWLLSSQDRETRRRRCAAEASKELGEQSKWLGFESLARAARNEDAGKLSEAYEHLNEHVIPASAGAARGTGIPGYSNTAVLAAEWIEDNPPPHEKGLSSAFGPATKAFYSIGSSFTHGYHWTLNVIDGETDYYNLVADALISAVLVTECAVGLFEAQTLAEGKHWETEHLSPRLKPTITAWAPRYYQSEQE
ncbi:hypothetical protein [Nocardia sp. NPDC058705]|uniref:hypothetical protein n=1 Tax=Nocardia sp. NPDC058705 TaxID=3346609 RepID=UPI003679E5E9